MGNTNTYSMQPPANEHIGFLSANTLKLIAIIAMLIDHIASLFVEYDSPLGLTMHFIGRITGPTMFYFAAAGYRYTRNVNRYTLRLALFALITYVPFIYCFTGSLPNADNFLRLNVIYTILIGHLCIRARHEIRNPALKAIVIIVLFVLSCVGDWYFLAPLMMLAFDLFHGNFRDQAISYVLIILGAGNLLGYLMNPFLTYAYQRVWDFSSITGSVEQFGMFLPIILLYFYNGKKGRGGTFAKWGFYIFYPLHLIILGLISNVLVK